MESPQALAQMDDGDDAPPPIPTDWGTLTREVTRGFSQRADGFYARRRRPPPYRFDRILRYLRYGVLAWVAYMTAATGQLVFADIDPYFTLFNLWSDEIAVGGIVALLVVVVLSLFVERPFCKYACPYGAVLGITNLFRVFSIRRNTTTCIDCGVCDRSCPMNIPVSSVAVVRNHQCITCMKCASEQACPVGDTVELRIGRFDQAPSSAQSGGSPAVEARPAGATQGKAKS
jgi:ferredoxin